MVAEVSACLQSVMWVGLHDGNREYSAVVAIGVVWGKNSRKPVKHVEQAECPDYQAGGILLWGQQSIRRLGNHSNHGAVATEGSS